MRSANQLSRFALSATPSVGLTTYNDYTMRPTDVRNPDYYHRVVDCQWACPAHTNVPEYIRLIAQGRFTDAYLLNRESNVFPGILGRTCDRPCEPACRRGARRRQAGRDLPPEARRRRSPRRRHATCCRRRPPRRTARSVALIGAGPASLTVANDLMPLGYEVTIFEKLPRPGGLMRINIPAFRLPEQVLDEEIGYIIDMGVDVRYNTPVDSLEGAARQRRVRRGVRRQRRAEGQGARHSRPPRHRSDLHRHRLARVDPLRPHRLDRQARADHRRRQHGDGLLPLVEAARRAPTSRSSRARPRKYFKASPWELEDAEEEGVEIVENLQPVRFVIENGKLTGMEFDKFASIETNGRLKQEVDRPRDPPVRHGHPRHRPGQRVPVDRARHRPRVRQVGHAGRRQDDVHVARGPACSSAATRRSARRTSSGRSSTATRRRSRSTTTARACRSPSARRRA